MRSELKQKIEQRLKLGRPLSQIRFELQEEGYMEEDVDEAIVSVSKTDKIKDEHLEQLKFIKIKSMTDRAGYGFAATQFINILFFMTGASLFLIGFLNAIKSALNTILSSILMEYSKNLVAQY